MASNAKPMSGLWTAFILILFTVLMVAAAWFLKTTWSYIAVMVLMVLFMGTLGLKISGRPAGVLINDRNLMSLSRFQMVLWTVIIISAYLIGAIGRIRNGSVADALAIGLDSELWALLGISTASLIGTPLLQSTKKTKEADPNVADQTAAQTGETPKEVMENAQGLLYANASIKDAAFSDMFEGDEVGNTTYVDLAKVQMFFFTIVAALSYTVSLYWWLRDKQFLHPVAPATEVGFPAVSAGLIAILGISHGGYLINKSTDHTPPPPPAK